MSGYPPAPWHLSGDLRASVWLLPVGELPPLDVPGWQVLTIAGRAVVGAAYVRYRPPGVLSYSELLVAVLVRRRLRVAPTVSWIWVDSAHSLAGGRALWALPKELGRFTDEIRVWDDRGAVAEVALGRARRIPGRWRLRFSVVQPAGGTVLITPVTVSGEPAVARTSWRLHAPLAFLADRRPVVSFAVRGFDMVFGGTARGWHRALRRS